MKYFFSLATGLACTAGVWSTCLLASLLVLPATAQTLTNNGGTLTVQSGAVLCVSGSVQNAAGSTLQNNGTLELSGDLTSAGTFSGTGLLRATGTQDQTLTLPAGTSLGSLTVANTGASGQNRVLLPNDVTVTGTITLTAGNVRTASTAVLSLPDGATLVGETAGRVVQGNLRVVRASGSGNLDFGHGLTLDRTGLGQVTVTRTAGLQTAGVSYGQNGSYQGIDAVWQVQSEVGPTGAVPLTLQWTSDFDNGLTSFSQAQLWRAATAAGPWTALATGADASSRSLAGSTSSLGAFTVSNVANPLPVELVAFTVERRGGDALLRWTTAQEKNNARFEVEVSPDGRAFQRLGAVAGQGTSSTRHEYQFTDANLSRYGVTQLYYRLRQIDLNGTATLSLVRTVQVAGAARFAAQAWPNPFGAAGLQLTLQTGNAGAAEFIVYDALGRAVLGRQVAALPAGSTSLAWPAAAQLPPGVYYLWVQQAGQQTRLKLVRE
ncbi:T9SS C-terminal target domain-containing protein [Hymenobacter oligotrophus]|uniref:T9SS C-terminal target domain-containing protein n=1 Tax=Hymenobacter oligotrophus TaxID=2319843 RepID=A0A3B7RTY1_9BACT|nr:T9SS type A sorting domain-containing protein [Hymenobacter oligotrophus]AYA37697.1 T9SS C-terminal target domain-containing protein [Hymenobacter oligotrophus]